MGIMLQRTLPAGFIAPCLPTKAHTLPSGGLWLHEIKHDGFRIIARKDGERVRLYSRPGNDLDPPPLKWSDLRYVFDIQEDCNGKEAIQA